MTEQSTAPAAAPIQDKAPKPPGLMPKNIQAWVMLGLAVLMVVIMWLTGGKKAQTTPKSSVPTFQPPAQAVNEAQINALQSRIQELQREQQAAITQQNKFFGSLPPGTDTSTPAQVSSQAPEPAQPDPVQEEKKRRAYASLFASNVALSYRKEFAQPRATRAERSGSRRGARTTLSKSTARHEPACSDPWAASPSAPSRNPGSHSAAPENRSPERRRQRRPATKRRA